MTSPSPRINIGTASTPVSGSVSPTEPGAGDLGELDAEAVEGLLPLGWSVGTAADVLEFGAGSVGSSGGIG